MTLFKVRQKQYFFLFSLVVTVSAFFFSCTNFFSTSWAPWAARDPDKLVPAITADNVDELVSMAENNPDLSLAVLKKINDASKKAKGSDVNKLQGAAIDAAVNASGLAQAVLNAAGELINVTEGDDAKDIILKALDDMKNLEDASSFLKEILLPDPLNTDDFDAFLTGANADDLALAAALLIAGEAKSSGDPEEYVNESFNSLSPVTENEKLAMKMIDEIIARPPEELNGALKEILVGLNLI